MIHIISDDTYFSIGAQHLFAEKNKEVTLVNCNIPEAELLQLRFSETDTVILTTDNMNTITVVQALVRLRNTQLFLVIDDMNIENIERMKWLAQGIMSKNDVMSTLFSVIYPRIGGRDTKPNLSFRELRIMDLLANGMSPQCISKEIGISIKTVCGHKINALKKLGLCHLNARSVYIYGQIRHYHRQSLAI